MGRKRWAEGVVGVEVDDEMDVDNVDAVDGVIDGWFMCGVHEDIGANLTVFLLRRGCGMMACLGETPNFRDHP